MTMVQCKLIDNGYGYEEIDLKGHAGDPLVCAAISSLITTLAGYLNNYAKVLKMDIADGDVNIIVSPTEKSNNAFGIIHFGFLQLQNKYPDKIQIS